ncbi:YihY/virulence factor BrkB family protein [Amphibacillus xylanus]|uniref:Putative ribonuclease n=1 Tax=Amphibacillus xylanus (strain ATCC 51415 / DSM 6626 / JCM 7361 / LMG 17667 / NBRC 15112 / Ep01) TaxID=698758 RepID=K0IW98_AMPXN|nr:YihY/virulence factor BrkB family protein [Amphibacillus xylanus]BAM46735.1 putative ribonuclease [Amphibacillus xylanus NBRC 15112]
MAKLSFDSIKKNFLELVRRFSEDEITSLSAQLSYFFLLSLFPLLIFSVAIASYLPIDYMRILEMMSNYIPVEAMQLIENFLLETVESTGGGLLSIAIIGTIWSASNGINAIMRALNKAYDVEENRPFILGRLIAISLLISVLLIIVVALLLPIFGRMIGVYIFSFFGASEQFITVWNNLRWIISSSIFFIGFLYLYRMAPNTKVYLKDAVWGALFTTIGWQISSYGFSLYVNTMGNYSATYGSLCGVIILMLWFYISSIIIIVGGEINAIIADKRGRLKR